LADIAFGGKIQAMFRQGIQLVVLGTAVLYTTAAGDESLKKLSKSEAARAALSKASPDYPEMARQLKMQGTVELEAVISEDGSMEDVRIVSGNPVLTKAAAQALRKWKFTPVTEGGKAVKAVAPVELAFKL
jgi:protein TonB